MEFEEEEDYGINKEHAHPRARLLAPEEFFWNGGDELAPFGSDEGFTALQEFRDWRKENPTLPLLDCLIWTIESVGGMDIEAYDESTIQAQLVDEEFNREQYVSTLDVSVLATGFGQLVDEGRIDLDAKPLIQRAIDRQLRWNSLPGALIPAE